MELLVLLVLGSEIYTSGTHWLSVFPVTWVLSFRYHFIYPHGMYSNGRKEL